MAGRIAAAGNNSRNLQIVSISWRSPLKGGLEGAAHFVGVDILGTAACDWGPKTRGEGEKMRNGICRQNNYRVLHDVSIK